MINTKQFKISPLIILLCLCLYSLEALAQNHALRNPVKQLSFLQNLKPQEKIYLHTDRSGYTAGERVWFKAYYADATSHALIKSNTLMYLELIDQQKNVILKRYVKITNGVGNGDFKIPLDQPKGEYVIRAYTRYMQNFSPDFFFTKKIKLLSIKGVRTAQLEVANNQKNEKSAVAKLPANKAKLDVQFFPEGGNLIDNLANQVAIKAINSNGLGINVKGKIVDSKDKELIRFSSVKFGMGKFILVPKPQEKYTAIVEYKGKKYTFKLPESKPTGYKMQVTSTPEYVQIMTEVSRGYSVENCNIVAHVRGHVVTQYTYKKTAPGFVLRIPKKDLPTGILHLTLFDQAKQPQCERLVFVEQANDLQQVKVTSPKTAYTHRQKAVFNLELKDENGKPIKGQASLAIVRDDLEADQSQKMNIQNYLWLKSDLKGRIENPAYYFNPQNKSRYQVMDLLMMTQGWRRFKWSGLPKMVASNLKYEKEEGFTISGQLLKLSNQKKAVMGKVEFVPLEDVKFAGEVKTDAAGRFVLKNLQIEDTINLAMTGVRLIKKKRSGKIKERRNNILLKHNGINPIASAVPDNYLESASTDFIDEEKQLNQAYKIFSLDPSVVALKEVKVTQTRPSRIISKIHMTATNSVDFSKIDQGVLNGSFSVFDVLRYRIPQVTVVGTFPYQRALIRGSNPLYLLDNTPVGADMLSNIPVDDIAYVDVLTTSRSAIYGMGGSNGVIAMYTKDAMGIEKKPRPTPGVINIVHPGYSKAREFYVPKYASQNIPKSQADYRSILFWKPSVTLDKDGKAKVEFFTSDETARYRIEVEGISDKGKVILGTYNFVVK